GGLTSVGTDNHTTGDRRNQPATAREIHSDAQEQEGHDPNMRMKTRPVFMLDFAVRPGRRDNPRSFTGVLRKATVLLWEAVGWPLSRRAVRSDTLRPQLATAFSERSGKVVRSAAVPVISLSARRIPIP